MCRVMSNNKLNDDCIIFIDEVVNSDANDRTREDVRSVTPESVERQGRFRTPCCEYLVEYIDKFKEVYDGHIGLGFIADGEDYFEDFTNCPFCGAPISYVTRKKFRMVPGKLLVPGSRKRSDTFDPVLDLNMGTGHPHRFGDSGEGMRIDLRISLPVLRESYL